MPDFTLDEQIKSVGREIGLRKSVYPKFLKSGRITEAKADYEIKCMEAVYETLKGLKANEAQPVRTALNPAAAWPFPETK